MNARKRDESLEQDLAALRERMAPLRSGVRRPYALSGELLLQKLPASAPKRRRAPWVTPLASAACALVIVAGALLAGRGLPAQTKNETAMMQAAMDSGTGAVPEEAPMEIAEDGAAVPEMMRASVPFADIHAEGEFAPRMLALSDTALCVLDGSSLHVVDVQTLTQRASLALPDGAFPAGVFAEDGRAAVIMREYDEETGESSAAVYFAGLSGEPALTGERRQAGDYAAARLLDGTLYLVTTRENNALITAQPLDGTGEAVEVEIPGGAIQIYVSEANVYSARVEDGQTLLGRTGLVPDLDDAATGSLPAPVLTASDYGEDSGGTLFVQADGQLYRLDEGLNLLGTAAAPQTELPMAMCAAGDRTLVGLVPGETLALALYDMRHPTEPKQVSALPLEGENLYSDAVYDASRISVSVPWIGIPVSGGTADENGDWHSTQEYRLYNLEQATLTPTTVIEYGGGEAPQGLLTDGKAYTYSSGELRVTELASGNEIGKWKLE